MPDAPSSKAPPSEVPNTNEPVPEPSGGNKLTNELVFLQGIDATKQTLHEWNRHPWKVMRSWLVLSVGISLLLLLGVWIVAYYSTPDPSGVAIPGFNEDATAASVGRILFRNSLVLALHAFACVAGFIAGNSLPISAAKRSGFSRVVHEKAGPLAIGFVACATTFSLATQAYFIGNILSTLAAQVHLSNLHVLILLLPHAIPELTALFLPLAAWLVASRKDDWDQLLAATFVTVAIAIPVLVVAAITEVTVFPYLLDQATGR